jgi:hypothetical protein
MEAGGATGNRTPIPAVRVQRSPVELSPQLAGREGIEPSLRVLEARPVTMTLRPKWRPSGRISKIESSSGRGWRRRDTRRDRAISAPCGN